MAFFKKPRGDRQGKGIEKRNFDKRRFGDRDGGRPPLHKATCSECGNPCEVPFRPTGSRPVFCNACFKKDGEGSSYDRPFRKPERGHGKGGFSRDQEWSPMHQAICEECGSSCEVPFKPKGDKPIYCNNCFRKGGNDQQKDQKEHKEQLEIINIKLDRIMKSLAILTATPPVVSAPELEEVAPVEKKKKTTKKSKKS